MDKSNIVKRLYDIFQSHENEIKELLSDGKRIVVTFRKDVPAEICITKQMDTMGRGSGIMICHDGEKDVFPSREALLFSIRHIGCERFYNAQKKSKVISQERPNNVKESSIAELQEEDVIWYVNLNCGIDQRISFLNNIYKELGIAWSAERQD